MADECPRCGAPLTTEPHFPDGAAGGENRAFQQGCHACFWRER